MVFLKTLCKIHRNKTLALEFFFNKVAGLQPVKVIEKVCGTDVFNCILQNFLEKLLLKNIYAANLQIQH